MTFAAMPFGHVDINRWHLLGYNDDNYELFLDGVLQKHVIEFHDIERWAERYVVDECGGIVTENGVAKTERITFKTLAIRKRSK